MGTLWLGYIVAAFAASALFAVAGWRSKTAAEGAARSAAWKCKPPADPAPSTGDVAEAIRVALHRLHSLIQDHHSRLDVAIEPGLLVPVRGDMLADMAEELLALGIGAGPGRHFLLTASSHAGRVDITLSDDCAAPDIGLRYSKARNLAQRVALQGGSLEVLTQPGRGTTMTVRLACAADAPPDVAVPAALPEPALQLR